MPFGIRKRACADRQDGTWTGRVRLPTLWLPEGAATSRLYDAANAEKGLITLPPLPLDVLLPAVSRVVMEDHPGHRDQARHRRADCAQRQVNTDSTCPPTPSLGIRPQPRLGSADGSYCHPGMGGRGGIGRQTSFFVSFGNFGVKLGR